MADWIASLELWQKLLATMGGFIVAVGVVIGAVAGVVAGCRKLWKMLRPRREEPQLMPTTTQEDKRMIAIPSALLPGTKVTIKEITIERLSEYVDGVPQADNPDLQQLFAEGRAHWEKARYAEAIIAFERCLVLATRGSERAAIHIHMGNCNVMQDELNEAEAHYEVAFSEAKLAKEDHGIAASLSNLGLVCQLKGELDKALEYHEGAMKVDGEIGDLLGEGLDLEGKAAVLLRKGLDYAEEGMAASASDKLDEAFRSLQVANALLEELRLKVHKGAVSEDALVMALNSLGIPVDESYDPEEALRFLDVAMARLDMATHNCECIGEYLKLAETRLRQIETERYEGV